MTVIAYRSDLDLVVRRIDDGDGVRHLVLASPDDAKLPSFTPGSHIGITWAEKRANFYSLTNEPVFPRTYEISVLHQPEGSGGSSWVHGLRVGDRVQTTAARSLFPPQSRARRHILIAGGIGVTPILSHARWHAQWGNDFEVFYTHPADRPAHLEDLRRLCGDRLHAYTSRHDMWRDLGAALDAQPLGTEIYTCGPASLIGQVREETAARGWPHSRVHDEAFLTEDHAPRTPFTARLTDSGTAVDVGDDESLLEALERSGLDIPSMCRQGVCGECRIPVRRGAIDHRDVFLSPAEKDEGDCMMACISRAADTEIELAL